MHDMFLQSLDGPDRMNFEEAVAFDWSERAHAPCSPSAPCAASAAHSDIRLDSSSGRSCFFGTAYSSSKLYAAIDDRLVT